MRRKSEGSRGRLTGIAILAVLAVVAAACSQGSSSAGSNQSKVVQGGTLRIGSDSAIDSLNPFVGFEANDYIVWYYEYPYLAEYDTHNNIVPYFATSWSQSSDGKTWTFHTHTGKWSDGQPLTAADAAWTINTVVKFQDGATAFWAPNVAAVTSASAPNPSTLVVTYKHPVANALAELALMPILPEHVWAQYATGNGKALKTFNNAPVGDRPVVSGGPFQLVNYQQNQSALMKANPTFWGPKPHIDGWGFQFFSNDDAMVAALESDQIDAIEGVPNTDVDVLKNKGFNINTTPGVMFYDFIFNSNPKKPQHRELLNPKVREAFEYAIDRKQIIDVALNGQAEPGSTIVPPATGKWHDSSIQPLPFDIARANQILNSLGYQMGPNGIRIAEGHPMSYQVIIPTSDISVLGRTFQIIQNDFKQIGVQLTEKTLDPSAAFTALMAPGTKYLDYDLSMWDWIPYPDPSYILSVVMCDQYGGNSDSAYCNPAYDRLWHQQATETNPQKRLQIVYQMQEILAGARPYIVLAYPDVIDAYSKSWTGFYNEDGYGIFDTNGAQSLVQAHRTG